MFVISRNENAPGIWTGYPSNPPGHLIWFHRLLRTGAAADRRVVEADVAAATRLAAARQAVAAGLNHGLASLVAARAADAAAVFGVFALANTAGQIALADGDTVAAAGAAAEAVAEHAAEVLQRATSDFIFANVV